MDPLVDPTRMRQTNPVAFRQAPSAAVGSARTAAPSPLKASTSRGGGGGGGETRMVM